MAQIMKERRIELGKEINEAAEITRIKESYLKAIEEEDFSRLPIAVYTKGYIREYAKYLGVYAEDIIANYERYLDEKKGLKSKVAADTAVDKPLNVEAANQQAGQKGPLKDNVTDTSIPVVTEAGGNYKKALLILSSIAIIVAIYLLVPQSEKAPEMPLTPPAPVQQVPPVNSVQQDNQPVPQTSTQVPTEKAEDKTKTAKAEARPESKMEVKPEVKTDAKVKNETAAAGQKKKYSLDIKATDKVWLQIIIDGSEKKEMTLNVGDRLVYGADESFNVLIGNAAGVTLKYNDKNFGALGEKGQVVRLDLPEMNSPQVVTPKKKDPGTLPSELPKPQTPNQEKQ